jgi:hypothetical protein
VPGALAPGAGDQLAGLADGRTSLRRCGNKGDVKRAWQPGSQSAAVAPQWPVENVFYRVLIVVVLVLLGHAAGLIAPPG